MGLYANSYIPFKNEGYPAPVLSAKYVLSTPPGGKGDVLHNVI